MIFACDLKDYQFWTFSGIGRKNMVRLEYQRRFSSLDAKYKRYILNCRNAGDFCTIRTLKADFLSSQKPLAAS